MKTRLLMGLLIFTSFGLVGEAKIDSQKTVDLTVSEKGFHPKQIDVTPGTDVALKVTRTSDATCAKQIQVPSKNLKVDLPLNRPVIVALGKVEKGEVRFACGMDMMETGLVVAK